MLLFSNGHRAWGSISAAIPLFPAILVFISNITRIGLKASLKLAWKALPVVQIDTHFGIWKTIMKCLKDKLHLKLKLLVEKDESAEKDLKVQLALKEGELNFEKS